MYNNFLSQPSTMIFAMELKIITIEDEIDKSSSVLKNKAKKVSFPLSTEDKQIISSMQKILFKAEGVGLAAPQVNIGLSIAVVYIPESASLLREDVRAYSMHTMINPEYMPINEDEIVSDFEGCYSVKSVYGKVPRYKSINLKYQNEDGVVIEQIVERDFDYRSFNSRVCARYFCSNVASKTC